MSQDNWPLPSDNMFFCNSAGVTNDGRENFVVSCCICLIVFGNGAQQGVGVFQEVGIFGQKCGYHDWFISPVGLTVAPRLLFDGFCNKRSYRKCSKVGIRVKWRIMRELLELLYNLVTWTFDVQYRSSARPLWKWKSQQSHVAHWILSLWYALFNKSSVPLMLILQEVLCLKLLSDLSVTSFDFLPFSRHFSQVKSHCVVCSIITIEDMLHALAINLQT